MDRAAMQNLLLFGGGGGQQGMGGGNDQQGQQQLQGGGNADGQGGAAGGMSAQDFQNQAFAGYPALMRQYLQQQQQQQQGMGGFPNQASFMGGMGGAPGGPPGGGQGPGGPEGAGNNMGQMMAQMNMAQMGGYGGQAGAAGFLPQGLGGGGGGGQPGAPDYMDANRMLLQRLQGQNQPEQQFAAGDAANGADPYAENGILGPWSATSAGLLGKMAVNTQDKGKKVRRKPKDKPKRPLSAYNIFFKEERQRILEKIPEEEGGSKGSGDAKTRKRKKRPHGKIGFENLAKVIGQRWQELTPEQVEYYKSKANEDMKRYKDQMESYLAKQDDGKKKKDSDGDDSGEDEVKSPAKKIKSGK